MKKTIQAFDKFLKKRGLAFSAIIIGGAALNILDITDRKTKDVDCLDPEIPKEIKQASEVFAQERVDLALDRNWFNSGPQTLKTDLSNGWRSRLVDLYLGEALHLQVLGRDDFLKSKLFAYCDRMTPDFEDLKALNPTFDELKASLSWVKERDGNPDWSTHVEKAFSVLKKALGHE